MFQPSPSIVEAMRSPQGLPLAMAAKYHPPHSVPGEGITMDGRIRGVGKCTCGSDFKPIMAGGIKDQIDLVCRCGARPRYMFIDARPWGERIRKDPRTGKKWDSFGHARRYLMRMNDEKDAHTFDRSRYVPAKMKEMTVAVEAAKWLASIDPAKFHSRHESSKNAMEKYILPAIGKMDVRDVRRSHLDDLKEKVLAMGRDPSSVKTYLKRAGAFFRWMADRETIPSVPILPKVDIPYKRRNWINRQGQEAILAHISSRHRLIWELIVETGIRQGEACGLLVRDIEGGEVIIERALDALGREKGVKASKDGEIRRRYVNVSLPLYARLEAHAKGRFGADPLFRNKEGFPYKSRGLWSIWHEASIKARLPISPREGTRHSKASQMRKEKEMYRDISEQLGNTPAVAKGYARTKGEEVK